MGDLKAALAWPNVMTREEAMPIIVAAARQMLRLNPPCETCGGSGVKTLRTPLGPWTKPHTQPCLSCLGSGVGEDQALIEAVAEALDEVGTDRNLNTVARAVLAALRAELSKEAK